ncbi:exocyst complex, component 1/SEC3 [Kipferlia bialata]|uniref:Exocyst complex, component 1/SEC3 n=1 Tax=Kipferlia bialata TaxID=797122 RepID=A0A9K3CRI6_9EUKA|nr:exocyst complex, component 1/SEC3 [Kipferlia bialata]|eukprot:g3023.t1
MSELDIKSVWGRVETLYDIWSAQEKKGAKFDGIVCIYGENMSDETGERRLTQQFHESLFRYELTNTLVLFLADRIYVLTSKVKVNLLQPLIAHAAKYGKTVKLLLKQKQKKKAPVNPHINEVVLNGWVDEMLGAKANFSLGVVDHRAVTESDNGIFAAEILDTLSHAQGMGLGDASLLVRAFLATADSTTIKSMGVLGDNLSKLMAGGMRWGSLSAQSATRSGVSSAVTDLRERLALTDNEYLLLSNPDFSEAGIANALKGVDALNKRFAAVLVLQQTPLVDLRMVTEQKTELLELSLSFCGKLDRHMRSLFKAFREGVPELRVSHSLPSSPTLQRNPAPYSQEALSPAGSPDLPAIQLEEMRELHEEIGRCIPCLRLMRSNHPIQHKEMLEEYIAAAAARLGADCSALATAITNQTAILVSRDADTMAQTLELPYTIPIHNLRHLNGEAMRSQSASLSSTLQDSREHGLIAADVSLSHAVAQVAALVAEEEAFLRVLLGTDDAAELRDVLGREFVHVADGSVFKAIAKPVVENYWPYAVPLSAVGDAYTHTPAASPADRAAAQGIMVGEGAREVVMLGLSMLRGHLSTVVSDRLEHGRATAQGLLPKAVLKQSGVYPVVINAAELICAVVLLTVQTDSEGVLSLPQEGATISSIIKKVLASCTNWLNDVVHTDKKNAPKYADVAQLENYDFFRGLLSPLSHLCPALAEGLVTVDGRCRASLDRYVASLLEYQFQHILAFVRAASKELDSGTQTQDIRFIRALGDSASMAAGQAQASRERVDNIGVRLGKHLSGRSKAGLSHPRWAYLSPALRDHLLATHSALGMAVWDEVRGVWEERYHKFSVVMAQCFRKLSDAIPSVDGMSAALDNVDIASVIH